MSSNLSTIFLWRLKHSDKFSELHPMVKNPLFISGVCMVNHSGTNEVPLFVERIESSPLEIMSKGCSQFVLNMNKKSTSFSVLVFYVPFSYPMIFIYKDL